VKVDIFCEVEKAGIAGPNGEYDLFQETLQQASLADQAGYDCWWEVEHHTAFEMSHSSAPDLMLTAIAARTRQMRIGHSAVLAPHNFSHPIRIAERAATLDLLSDGRLELGFARSTVPEWRIFQIPEDETRQQLETTMRMVPQMWRDEPFSWNDGRFAINNARIIPKPRQKPHPPLWQACSSLDSFRLAARCGVGALGVTLLTPIEVLATLIQSYREAIVDADPAGAFVNNQVGVFTFVHCAETTREAIANGAAEAAAWYINSIVEFFEIKEMLAAMHSEIPSDIAGKGLVGLEPAAATPAAPVSEPVKLVGRLARGEHVSSEEVYEILDKEDSVIIGDPETCRRKFERYREIGADRLLCFQQVGALSCDSIMRSMELIAEHQIPYFAGR
jgi:alkanesulfonate monooxygenase SsuD/methylene tetrahydromethanopterin reductase-like flavin-dependent oxidoreductase (luciferase family)